MKRLGTAAVLAVILIDVMALADNKMRRLRTRKLYKSAKGGATRQDGEGWGGGGDKPATTNTEQRPELEDFLTFGSNSNSIPIATTLPFSINLFSPETKPIAVVTPIDEENPEEDYLTSGSMSIPIITLPFSINLFSPETNPIAVVTPIDEEVEEDYLTSGSMSIPIITLPFSINFSSETNPITVVTPIDEEVEEDYLTFGSMSIPIKNLSFSINFSSETTNPIAVAPIDEEYRPFLGMESMSLPEPFEPSESSVLLPTRRPSSASPSNILRPSSFPSGSPTVKQPTSWSSSSSSSPQQQAVDGPDNMSGNMSMSMSIDLMPVPTMNPIVNTPFPTASTGSAIIIASDPSASPTPRSDKGNATQTPDTTTSLSIPSSGPTDVPSKTPETTSDSTPPTSSSGPVASPLTTTPAKSTSPTQGLVSTVSPSVTPETPTPVTPAALTPATSPRPPSSSAVEMGGSMMVMAAFIAVSAGLQLL